VAYHNLRSKLDRAVVAYLISVGAGSDKDTFPANSIESTEYPLTVAQTLGGIPDPVLVGNYKMRIAVSVKGSVSKFIDDTNDQAARMAHDERVSDVFDALMQSDDDRTLRATARLINAAGRALAMYPVDIAAHNADMADFTIIQWLDGGFGDGKSDEAGCDWIETLYFDVIACPSNVD